MAERLTVSKNVGPVEVGPRLTVKEQFWWGSAGGGLLLLFRLWIFASTLGDGTPTTSFRTCLICGIWLLIPFVSGIVSRALEPHHRLIALFEGASAPALFLLIARDFPM